MITRRIRWLTALSLVPALTGCSIGDIRRDPPDRATAPTASPSGHTESPPSPAAVAESRRVQVAVAKGYDPPYVEFVDAEHGYALFAHCNQRPPGRDCPALLYATTDGGRSWQKRRHPRPVADDQQMYAAPDVLALLSEPYGWWTSTDGGRTFRHTRGETPPAAWQAAEGRFQIIEGTGKVGRWDGRKLRPLPVQPDVPGLNVVAEGGGLLVASGARDGKPSAAISSDQGRSWRTVSVPAPDGDVGILWPEAAPDGDMWLIGERPDRMSFPALWRWTGRWELVRAEGHPERAPVAVPIGAGLLAMVSERGAGVVVGDRYADLPWPLTSDHYLRMLGDGTLVAPGPDGTLLGKGHNADRTWTRIILEPA